MWVVFLLLLSLFFSVILALAEPGFSEKYERDYNFNKCGARLTGSF